MSDWGIAEYRTRGGRRVAARRRERAGAVSFARRLDWLLLAAVGALAAYGLWAIAGVTRYDVPGEPDFYVDRQAVALALGAVGLVVASLIDPALYRRHVWALYLATIGVMLLVVVLGQATRGSKRWIDVGSFRFQPSEFGKLLLVLVLAAFLADRWKRISDGRTPLLAVGLAAPPTLLVFLQPDLGTALVYGAGLVAVLVVAGTRWTHLAALGAVGVGVIALALSFGPAVGLHPLKEYQVKRLTAFTDPESVPPGATYNLEQSITAVGAGGIHGRGIEGATQTRLDYLPEHATDFVFASLAEQRGFIGASVLLLLYLLVVWRGLRIVTVARDPFSAMVAGGIVFAFLFQIFVNVGMTMGIAPITGIPLPFVSVGGSSLLANLVAIGVLQAIHARGTR